MRALWHHDYSDEPVELFSEIGDDDYEVRKVDVFRDGRTVWADETCETDGTGLAQVPIPALAEINAEREFTAVAISAEDFEDVWRRAVAG